MNSVVIEDADSFRITKANGTKKEQGQPFSREKNTWLRFDVM